MKRLPSKPVNTASQRLRRVLLQRQRQLPPNSNINSVANRFAYTHTNCHSYAQACPNTQAAPDTAASPDSVMIPPLMCLSNQMGN